MDVAVVTGASSSAGLSVARKLVAMGLRVYGLDADFTNCSWEHPEFQRVECDLFRQEKVALAWKEIVGRDPGVSILVHAAMAKLEGALEAAHPDDIRRALEARLMGPALLTRYALPRLIRIRGSVFFVNRRGGNAVSAMIEGGIASLTDGLYAEVRDTGVKVSQIAIEANTEAGDDEGRHTRIDPDAVAEAVESVLRLPAHNSVTRLILRPQATREEPFAAASTPLLRWGPDEVRLPEPENFPEEPEPIYTPERRRPADAPPPEEDDDEFEDEDDELDRLLEESRQRLRNQVDRQRQSDRGRQQNQPRERQQGQQSGGESGDGEGRNKKKRRRGRRRGRNRNRDREPGNASGEGGSPEQKSADSNQPRHEHGERPARESSSAEAEHSRPRETSPEPKPEPKPKEQSAPDTESKPKKKVARKAAKKAVKKAAKKAVKKAAKKAVKKTANKEPQPETES